MPPKHNTNTKLKKKKQKYPGILDFSTGSDCDYYIWDYDLRPEDCQPVQDASFVVEDEQVLNQIEKRFNLFVVTSPLEEDNPIVYISPGLEKVLEPKEKLLRASCQLQYQQRDVRELDDLFDENTTKPLVMQLIFGSWHSKMPKEGWKCAAYPVYNDFRVQYLLCCIDNHALPCKNHEESASCIGKQTDPSISIVNNSNNLSSFSCWNQQWARQFCFGEQLVGQSMLALCGPSSSRQYKQDIIQSFQNGRQFKGGCILYNNSGHAMHCLTIAFPLADEKFHCQEDSQHEEHMVLFFNATSSSLKRVGKYTLGRVLGKGSFGVVRVAKLTSSDSNDTTYAIKTVDCSKFTSIQEMEMLQEETAIMQSLNHPNVVRMKEYIVIDQIYHFVMDHASGGSLIDFAKQFKGRKCPENIALLKFKQIVQALDYCHRRRIVHRDLKPENILLDAEGNIKIADFGLSAVTSPFSGSLSVTCGTPEFAAPELLSGKEYSGTAVDIWSLGVILYELLTGTLPYTGKSPAGLVKSIQRDKYKPLPSSISSECADVIKQLLTIDPNSRITLFEIMQHPWYSNKNNLGECDGSGHRTTAGRGFSSSYTGEPCAQFSLDSKDQPDKHQTDAIHESVKLVLPEFTDLSMDGEGVSRLQKKSLSPDNSLLLSPRSTASASPVGTSHGSVRPNQQAASRRAAPQAQGNVKQPVGSLPQLNQRKSNKQLSNKVAVTSPNDNIVQTSSNSHRMERQFKQQGKQVVNRASLGNDLALDVSSFPPIHVTKGEQRPKGKTT